MPKITNTQFPGMRRIHHIHFIGIGGIGMSGIAEVLYNEGYQVTGSDLKITPVTERLEKLGVKIFEGHAEKNIKEADVVVISSAVHEENVELVSARAARIPIVPRAEMLAELMRFRDGIAIAGTHGKTTTTSLVTSILAEAGLDPTFIIGGKLNSADTNARLGSGRYLVAEADESDASFLMLQPTVSIVTNIDMDHMETYHGDIQELKKAFLNFLHRLPFYGLAIVCLDDSMIQSVIQEIGRPLVTYGWHNDADLRLVDFEQKGTSSNFRVVRRGHSELSIHLNLPGKHNALNALAAIAVAMDLGVSDEIIYQALSKFGGVGRRFQQLGEHDFAGKQVLVIDDYGHHPKEIEMTIESARAAFPDRRLVMLFQPHRYTRTRDLFEDFSRVLSEVDQLLLLEVYSAGEKEILGADARTLARSIRNRGKVDPIFVEDKKALREVLNTVLQNQDVLITQGAGDISALIHRLING